jgi:hypothetical protein
LTPTVGGRANAGAAAAQPTSATAAKADIKPVRLFMAVSPWHANLQFGLQIYWLTRNATISLCFHRLQIDLSCYAE